MNKFTIITFGGVTQDIMFYTTEGVLIKNPKDPLKQELIGFEYGAKIRSDKVHFAFGGGGGNTAVSFSLMGLKTALVACFAQDRIYDDYRKQLLKNKINGNLLQLNNNSGSGFSFILNYGDYNEHVVFSYRGANNYLKVKEKTLKSNLTDWYYLAGLSGKYLDDNLKLIFKTAKAKNNKIAWNPGISELKKGYRNLKNYLKQTELFIVNYDEAIELALSAGIKTNNQKKLLISLYNFGSRFVAISHGHRGAYLFDGKKIYFEKALPINGINTTGAGDAFGSSLVAGLILFKNDLRKSLKLAIIRSNYVIRKIGAQVNLLNKKQSLKLLNKHEHY